MSRTFGKIAVDLVAIVVAIAAVVVAALALQSSNSQANKDEIHRTRMEILTYLQEMSELDRSEGTGNTNEITARTKQVNALISSFDNRSDLGLDATIYRELAWYTALDTVYLDLAKKFADHALDDALQPPEDRFEAIQTHLVKAEISIQVGDVEQMRNHYEQAIEWAEQTSQEPHLRFVRQSATATYLYWARGEMRFAATASATNRDVFCSNAQDKFDAARGVHSAREAERAQLRLHGRVVEACDLKI